MKKFFAVLLALVLLLSIPCRVSAASSASLSGPGTVRAGDTITVAFKAGGGIYGGSGAISFDSSQLTLQSYKAAIGGSWAVEFAGNNFVFYDNSMADPISSATIFKATFKVSESLKTGTKISVNAKGVTLSDGTNDNSVGTVGYSVKIAAPLSGNANLKSLTVSNATISPDFSPKVTEYTASVPFSTASLKVTAEAEHAGAKVTIGNTGLTAGGTTDVIITVTAENGSTKTYRIRTRREQDPNYVESDVNTLNTLSAEGFQLSPKFDPQCLHYAVYLPYEVESLKLSAERTDSKSKVALPEVTGIGVGENTYEIPVTAENGDVRIYTLTVFRADVYDPTAEPTEPPTEPATEPTTELPTEPVTEPATEPTTQPAVEAPTEPAAEPEPGKNTDLWWLWIPGALLCFCLGGLTVFCILGRKRRKYRGKH